LKARAEAVGIALNKEVTQLKSAAQQIKPVDCRQLAKEGPCGKNFAAKLLKELRQTDGTAGRDAVVWCMMTL
jgi:hypothetical protein